MSPTALLIGAPADWTGYGGGGSMEFATTIMRPLNIHGLGARERSCSWMWGGHT
jgi:hypothetical protein